MRLTHFTLFYAFSILTLSSPINFEPVDNAVAEVDNVAVTEIDNELVKAAVAELENEEIAQAAELVNEKVSELGNEEKVAELENEDAEVAELENEEIAQVAELENQDAEVAELDNEEIQVVAELCNEEFAEIENDQVDEQMWDNQVANEYDADDDDEEPPTFLESDLFLGALEEQPQEMSSFKRNLQLVRLEASKGALKSAQIDCDAPINESLGMAYTLSVMTCFLRGLFRGASAGYCIAVIENKPLFQTVMATAKLGIESRLIELQSKLLVAGSSAFPFLVAACSESKVCEEAALAFMMAVNELAPIASYSAAGALTAMLENEDVSRGALAGSIVGSFEVYKLASRRAVLNCDETMEFILRSVFMVSVAVAGSVIAGSAVDNDMWTAVLLGIFDMGLINGLKLK